MTELLKALVTLERTQVPLPVPTAIYNYSSGDLMTSASTGARHSDPHLQPLTHTHTVKINLFKNAIF